MGIDRTKTRRSRDPAKGGTSDAPDLSDEKLYDALEYSGAVTDVTNPLTALCMLEYYFYLSVIYQQEMRERIAEKELYITKQKMDLLRSQIHPHFIFNSLSASKNSRNGSGTV